MSRTHCSRLWQVEAGRDGRLSGKDLASAVRHRETCAECAAEERALTTLADALAALPELERDALSARRTRQNLMSALNDSLIAAPRPQYARHARRVAAVAALVSTLVASWRAMHLRRVTPVTTPQIIDVYAAPGARWSAHTDALSAKVDFTDGAASFVVHPHQGRRVVVRLPDGEVEDMGTVFEVRVNEQRTRRVAVSEGKLVVRLAGRPEFSLAAGEAWEWPPTPAAASSAASSPRTSELVAAPRPATAPIHRAVSAASRPRSAPTVTADASSANAEDDAYLHIVSLLRNNRAAQARGEAKLYLLRFPNGFRRVEVLNIAMRGGNDDAAPSN